MVAVVRSKSQSAMEYLMTYGWAILIIAIVLGALFQLGVFNGQNFAPKAPPGACQVFRPNGPGSTLDINLEGECQGELPEYVAQFNGQTSTINIPDSGSLSPNQSMTITVWVYMSSISSNWGELSWKQSNNRAWWFGFYPNSASDILWSIDGDNGCNVVSALDSWQFIAVTFNSTSGKAWYNNGGSSPVCSVSMTNTIPGTSTGTPIYIGGTTWAPITGYMANMQIYNVSLNANEIRSLYLEGIGGAPIDPYYVAGWWPLNGNANDYSGNGNNGQATGVSYTNSWTSGYSAP